MPKRRKSKKALSRKERYKQIGKWGSLALLTYESYRLFVGDRQRRRDVFNLALQKQHESGKQLVVIGDPSGHWVSRLFGKDYDCGDVCIDPKGCPGCKSVITEPLETALPQLAAGSAVIFATTGALESTADFELVLGELQRVSGGDIFVAHSSPWSLLSLLPPRKRWIMSAPPTTPFTSWRELPWRPGPSTQRRIGRVPQLRVLAGGRRG